MSFFKFVNLKLLNYFWGQRKKIVSLQAKISDTPIYQKFFDLQKWEFWDLTNTHTDRHGNSMTELAQWADSLKNWIGGKICFKTNFKFIILEIVQ